MHEEEIRNALGRKNYEEIVQLKNRKDALEYSIEVLKKERVQIRKQIHERCNHPIVYKFGKNDLSKEYEASDYTHAELKCLVCDYYWEEGKNVDFTDLRRLADEAVKVTGSWDM